MATSAFLECVLCEQPFKEEDVSVYRYFIETGICYSCYLRMQKAPVTVCCFGKNGRLGYNPLKLECKVLCPDRKVCPTFAFHRIKKLRHDASYKTITVLESVMGTATVPLPFRVSSVIGKAFELCMKGVSPSALSRFAKKENCNLERIVNTFRSGICYNKQWKWSETNGLYKIHYPVQS